MSQVRVGVRIRPLTSDEQAQGGKSIVNSSYSDSTIELLDRKFTFDSVYDETVPQDQLYNCVGSDRMLEAFLDGYNSTIMAYGQTGSGKTFTMGSEANYSTLSSEDIDSPDEVHLRQGLIPRFMSDIFKSLHQRKIQNPSSPNKENISDNQSSQLIDYKVSASFLEVYGENIHDLLSEDSRQILPLREDEAGKIVVVGLKEQPISSAEDALQVLNEGTLNRTTAATLMNKKSSRSHAVFTIRLRQTVREINPDANDGKGSSVDVTIVSCFTFVDLAGSERMKKTGAEGERAKEGIMINQGLLALGNVINALADEERLKKGKKVHVPYRESKLTRLLQDALGGNSQTLFLACISPSDTNASETASTLKYANRARNIRNVPTKNIDATLAELQRLYALNQLLERELIQTKFGRHEESKSEEVGVVNNELLERDDVKQYLILIREKANENRLQPIAPPPLQVASVPNTLSSTSFNTSHPSRAPSTKASRRSQIIENIDECVLGVDPDGDIALLDKLLELQRLDQEFENEAQKDQAQLEQVVGELAAQEQLLLQLKTNLQGYHHLKDRFESMMIEIQSLENEKKLLAKELENAQIDPSKGCSKSIKKRLEDVESKLERTRVEGKKYQQLYRKAEHEAKKAAALQQKIDTLKQGKVTLVKKQREAVAKYKELSDTKTREINLLKRKERKVGQQLTKLETEIRNHKMHLQRRNDFCNKLSEKLKQTEAHLMKIMSMRKRDMLSKTNMATKSGTIHSRSSMSSQLNESDSEEISSMKFLLDRLIHDRVNMTVMRSSYESKVSEYSDLMRTMVTDMKTLKAMKDELERYDEEDDTTQLERNIQNLQDTIEDTEFRVHALEKELDKIKSKLPGIDDPDSNVIDQRATKFELDAMHMIDNLNDLTTKHLLKDMINVAAKHQATKFIMDEKLKRKDAALTSFENEIESLNQRIAVLSQDRESRKSTSPSLLDKKATNATVNSLSDRILHLEQENKILISQKDQKNHELKQCEKDLCLMKEKFTVLEVTLRNSGVEVKTKIEKTIQELQQVWELIGISPEDRELVRHRIDSCLEFSCADELQVAKDLKQRYEEDIHQCEEEISSICKALGVQTEVHWVISKMKKTSSLIDQLKVLQDELVKLKPTYMDALQRRSKVALELRTLMDSMRLQPRGLTSNLSRLLALEKQSAFQRSDSENNSSKEMNTARKRRETQFKHVEDMVKALENASTAINDNSFSQDTDEMRNEGNIDDTNSLSDEYLDQCQRELKTLTMRRAEIKVTNQTLRDSAKDLASSMHLRGRELLSLSLQSMRKREKETPSWWNSQIAEHVCRSIASKDGVVEVSDLYTKHLSVIHEALQNMSIGRRELSVTLKDIVRRTHESLLHTVEAQLEDNDAYSYFEEALARLPPYSKEYVSACIDEMRTLIAAVDAMSQSEVEALTVVWDALNVRNSEKGDFWGQVEESLKEFSLQVQNPFETVVKACKNDVEEWLYGAVKEAQTIYRSLNAGVIKLNKIHEEVERLSKKQSVKSKIISIDSELRVLSVQLAEFEEKANSRQRLTQKSNSASLLKEERFRKQMQNEFSSKMKTLWELLSRWESIDGSKFDEKLLSNEVSLLLENPDKFGDWVQRRTAFMHLKTVQQKSTRKNMTPNSSPKRPKTSESNLVANSTIRPKTSNSLTSSSRRHISRTRSATSQSRNVRNESPAPFQKIIKVLSPATNGSRTQTCNALSKATTSRADKKYGGKDNISPPLANNPFGRILAKTPTSEKENFQF